MAEGKSEGATGRKSAVIFDFDGTIADSFAVVVRIFHDLTRRDEVLPTDEIERLRGMSLVEATKEMKIRAWKVPFLVARGRSQLRSHISDLKVFDGIPEVIHELGKEHKLYIMSSNSLQNISQFLREHGLDRDFIQVYAGVSLLGKAHVLRKVMVQNNLTPGDTYYIGDEVRDVEASKKAGVHMIAVTWGYNNAEALARHEPEHLVDKPEEIKSIL